MGRPTCPMAVSGSFRPLPVRTIVTVMPSGRRPCPLSLTRPASGAQDAGSAKTPPSLARSRWALRISPSDTALNSPPDSCTAARARCALTGFPMRMAVATVSGSGQGLPVTSGAAPSAWNPIIRGRAGIFPSLWYSE